MTTKPANNMAENKNNEQTTWQRMTELINKDGKIWAWNPEDFDKGGASIFAFDTVENAQEWAALRNQVRKDHGHALISYEIGTEQDYIEAAKNYSLQKSKNEVKAYGMHVEGEIKRLQQEIKCLETLQAICHEFDGKVINKRFHDTIKERTGFSNYFDNYSFKLDYYGKEYDYNNRPNIYISACWSSWNARDNEWRWGTNDRLAASEACAIIARSINHRNTEIAALLDAKKHYGEYLKKARKAEALIKELEKFHYDTRRWASEHDLERCCHHTSIWK